MTGNVLFNHVRETGDHGPFNSWDRQPYLTRNGVDDGFKPEQKLNLPGASFVGAQSHITHNLIINGYNGVWTIDHDDGSQRYNDTSNVLAWGGCKNYRGNGKSCDHNLILYPGIDERASGGRRCHCWLSDARLILDDDRRRLLFRRRGCHQAGIQATRGDTLLYRKYMRVQKCEKGK